MSETTAVTGTQDKKEIFTAPEIVDLAAKARGIELFPYRNDSSTRQWRQGKPFASKLIDEEFLRFLAERGFKRQERPDAPYVFTLVDENHQEPASGFHASNYWNFRLPGGSEKAHELKIELSVYMALSISERGIVIIPQAHGTGIMSPADRLPNIRMFKALVDSGVEVPGIAKEILASENSSVVIQFSDLGLGGIRTIHDLFHEFARGRPKITDMLNNRVVQFDPTPYNNMFDPECYMVEPAQPKTIAAWRKQLQDYRTAIDLP
jgi:hypothetical protein